MTTDHTPDPLAIVAAAYQDAARIAWPHDWQPDHILSKANFMLHSSAKALLARTPDDATAAYNAAMAKVLAKGKRQALEQAAAAFKGDDNLSRRICCQGATADDYVQYRLHSLIEKATCAADHPSCQSCGAPVQHDTWLPDDLFAQVSGDGGNGMFCPTCLVARCVDVLGWPAVRLSNSHATADAVAEVEESKA